jgi:hypothetical protein
VVAFTLRDWLRSEHQYYSLVLHGPPETGKTPIAKCCGLLIAECHEQPDGSPSRLYVVSVAEQLPRTSLRTGDVILLDEFNPMSDRGCQGPHTVDEMKALTDSAVEGGVSGKGSNSGTTGTVNLPAGVCKLFCANASEPHQWHSGIPPDVFSLDVPTLAGLPEHIRAILKRVAFLHVPLPLLAVDVVQQHRAASGSATTAAFDRLFGGDIP